MGASASGLSLWHICIQETSIVNEKKTITVYCAACGTTATVLLRHCQKCNKQFTDCRTCNIGSDNSLTECTQCHFTHLRIRIPPF